MSTLDFSRRTLLPELMDQPDIKPSDHRHALEGLARINYFSRSARILWPSLRDLVGQLQRPLRILDVACGGGDVVLQLWKRAHRQNLPLEFVGMDISELALECAQARADAMSAPIRFLRKDALRDTWPTDVDVIITSLFVHHLEETDAVGLLRKMAATSAQLVAVNDLRRSRAGYALAKLACHALTRSHVVHVDGPRSVAGAFTVPEMVELFRQAGLTPVTARPVWPCRMLAVWRRA